MGLKASNTLWGEVLSTTNYLKNRSPTKVIPHGKTCIEVWTRKKPNLSHLEIKFLHWSRKNYRRKLDHHIIVAHFLGIVMKAKPTNSWENMTKVY